MSEATNQIPPDTLAEINKGFALARLSWARYQNDVKFNAAVTSMVLWMERHKFTADDMKEAADMAESIVEAGKLSNPPTPRR